jgi:hypothetical protein
VTQQLHRSLGEVVIIARVGSMKFLLIMNGRVRRAATRAALRSRVRKHAGRTRLLSAWRSRPRRTNHAGIWWGSSPAGAAVNRFAHRIIMSVLLVAALVLIWNVLGAR